MWDMLNILIICWGLAISYQSTDFEDISGTGSTCVSVVTLTAAVNTDAMTAAQVRARRPDVHIIQSKSWICTACLPPTHIYLPENITENNLK